MFRIAEFIEKAKMTKEWEDKIWGFVHGVAIGVFTTILIIWFIYA